MNLGGRRKRARRGEEGAPDCHNEEARVALLSQVPLHCSPVAVLWRRLVAEETIGAHAFRDIGGIKLLGVHVTMGRQDAAL